MAGSRRLGELSARVRALGKIPSGPAAIALSGGADSAVVAWLMVEAGVRCRAIHIDHRLDGSPAMREAAAAIAARLVVDLDVREVDIPAGASPENQARIVRYSALESALRAGELLVTGHTRDDQAETVLLNILRGAGLDGLVGIPFRRGNLVRPILGVTRSETRELATLLGLPWRDDPANDDPDPRRNQIRRETIPDLERRFNPQLRTALASLAETVAAELPERQQRVRIRKVDNGVALAAPELHAVGPAAAKQALREAMRLVRGPHAGTRSEIDRLVAVAYGTAASAEVSGGIRAYRSGPWLIIARPSDPEPPAARGWAVPGEARFGSWTFAAWTDERPPAAYPLSSWTAVSDADSLPPHLTIRCAEPGDVIDGVPVAERLRRVGVPADQRSTWPVVFSGETVVWIPGAGISRSVWVGSSTRRYLWVNAAMEIP